MSTATATLPLHDLAARINQHETELAQLRQEYQARQTQLTALARRKEELQAQLDQVEAEIAKVDRATTAGSPSSKSRPGSPPGAKPAAGSTTGGGAAKDAREQISLPQLLICLVRHANKPMSLKDLVEGVTSRKYPTKAKNLNAMIKSRVSDLVRAKLLKRVADQPGVVVLGKVSRDAAATRSAAKPAASAKATGPEQKLSLKEAIIQVLAKSSRPLPAQEIADLVIANGYQSKSKDLKNVIWVCAGKMKNIENVKGEGYRLKGAAKKKNG
jgi:hypothetical protein